jgi:hypothetical protein
MKGWCMCVCVRARVCACVRACVRAPQAKASQAGQPPDRRRHRSSSVGGAQVRLPAPPRRGRAGSAGRAGRWGMVTTGEAGGYGWGGHVRRRLDDDVRVQDVLDWVGV